MDGKSEMEESGHNGGPVFHAEEHEPVEADAPTRVPWRGLVGLAVIFVIGLVALLYH